MGKVIIIKETLFGMCFQGSMLTFLPFVPSGKQEITFTSPNKLYTCLKNCINNMFNGIKSD